MSVCPLCGAASDPFLLQQAQQATSPVAELLAQRLPGWRANQGACPQCVLNATRQHARTRSSFPLHTRTQPNTTFPYYHPEDEGVLGLGERLPDYFTLPAQGVGIAFIDSGFFPHPDLCALPPPAGIQWERLAPADLRRTLLAMSPRLLDYVDLTADGEETGLEVESLWAGDSLSWHGEMTSTIAAGNGALSEGRYRGYASQAKVLPIRVGRGDGRIPEADILRGFEWLLEENRWQKYGIRVVNVSVGGDFPQDWRFNPISQAAMKLHEAGVLVVAAAGNRSVEELLPPAQTPTVLTVGGVNDHNLRWSPLQEGWRVLGERPPLEDHPAIYGHNFGKVPFDIGSTDLRFAYDSYSSSLRKPEILAPANYLASPMLPTHSAFRETHAIDRLRRTLRGNDSRADALVAHWQRILRHDPNPAPGPNPTPGGMLANLRTSDLAGDLLDDLDESTTAEWMGDIWQPLRKRMNAQKWVHAAYQHVDGTSVAAAVVSATAAQMVQANPGLDADELRSILCESAAPAAAFPVERRGAGVLQPAAAVAQALRARGGRLQGYPRSGTILCDSESSTGCSTRGSTEGAEDELRKWRDLVKIPAKAAPHASDRLAPVYFGLLAPDADAVCWLGEANDWASTALPLVQARNGWWHIVLLLPPGAHLYRFHTRHGGVAQWCADPESALRMEGGYLPPHGDHSLVIV